jgi:hypothetical protein
MAADSANESPATLRAALATRLLYSIALLSFILLTLAAGSGWVGLATGGGWVIKAGATVFKLIVALLLFRVYQVLRYPAALDARPPNAIGWLIRYAGLLALAVEAAAGLGILFLKPLTLVLFKDAGPNGIAYFAVSLGILMIARYAWIGILVFEFSRFCGRKTSDAGKTLPWSRRRQDVVIFSLVLATVITIPYLYRKGMGEPCGVTNLADCASSTEGGVARMIGLPYGEPVYLETEIEEISMYRGSGERRKEVLVESPVVSLDTAGHPVSPSPDTKVHVRLDASAINAGVVLTLTVTEGGEETARFATRFAKGAAIERTDAGKMRVLVQLPSNADPGMRRMYKGGEDREYYAIDQVFIQLRNAIGTEAEAREWPSRVVRDARPIDGTLKVGTQYADDRFAKGPVDQGCKDIVEARSDQAVSYQDDLGAPLWGAIFREAASPGPHALLSRFDRLVCYEDEIWIVHYKPKAQNVQMRRYTRDGRLLRFINASVPPAKLDDLDFDTIDPFSMLEDQGKIYFERVIRTLKGNKFQEKRRQLFEVVP